MLVIKTGPSGQNGTLKKTTKKTIKNIRKSDPEMVSFFWFSGTLFALLFGPGGPGGPKPPKSIKMVPKSTKSHEKSYQR